MVVAQFRDNSFFMFRQIKAWVDTWDSRGHIEVSKDNDVYYFYFQDPDDWAVFQGQYHTLNFKGGLLILRPWSLTMSYKSINFSETAIWVKAEGIPFILSTEEFTHNICLTLEEFFIWTKNHSNLGPKDTCGRWSGLNLVNLWFLAATLNMNRVICYGLTSGTKGCFGFVTNVDASGMC
ncbi:Transcription-repair-coupling factor [Bienertia sinuspersici]